MTTHDDRETYGGHLGPIPSGGGMGGTEDPCNPDAYMEYFNFRFFLILFLILLGSQRSGKGFREVPGAGALHPDRI